MISLLSSGQYAVFLILLFVIIFSLTFHEFGHAFSAKLLGDDTAEKMGRLNLNPMSHIDPIGLAAVIFIGFGYAKPVPFTPRKLKHKWGSAMVAAAGPLMNLLIAIVALNLKSAAFTFEIAALATPTAQVVLTYLALINILLMLFNLLPIGPLDGHYIAEWLLPQSLKYKYHQFNGKYGSMLFLGLIVLSIAGLPIFRFLWTATQSLAPYLTWV